MKMKNLGSSDIQVAPLAFGGNVFGWTVSEEESFKLLDTFVSHGLNLIDTADVYSNWVTGNKGGESETIIGNWLKKSGKRDQVIIATKVGMEMGPGQKGLAKEFIKRSVEDSLKRLQTDYIDLYQSHQDDPSTPLEETLSAYDDLIKAGKIRYIGASNYSGERLKEALDISDKNKLPRYITLQPRYNLYDREHYESEYSEFCRKNNIAVISYYSLASGFLTGKYRSEKDLGQSQRGVGVGHYLGEKGMKILAKLDEVSKQHRCTPAQASLAWLMAHEEVVAPIASATNLTQLEEIIKATELKLSDDTIKYLSDG